ncbi:MADS-box protein AeAP3-2-like isoform X2 [Tasmannia lanceolata]|uniref:MADS-box protein AeAP3-2-like isoform X2 n=1 Tax=Tasmannia lanceolata TaxID=3420 RepID=UPI0040649782
MGRGKIEIKRIENSTNRQVTFSKRRGGLLKKASELAVLCDVQLGLIIFSSSGKMFEYSNPPSSMRQLIDRYQQMSGNRIQEYDNQQIYCEVTRLKHEYGNLQASMRHFTGEDLDTLSLNDLHQIEEQLEISVSRVRDRKNQLLHQQMENLRRKLAEHQAAMEPKVVCDQPMLEHFGAFYQDEQARNMLQLSPQLHAFRLQPTQPNLQDATLQGHVLQL